jgi:hypothetical protein
MRSTVHSTFTTLLLLVPMLAIPLFAFFGVPKFVPLVEKFHLQPPAEEQDEGGEAPTFSHSDDLEHDRFDDRAEPSTAGDAWHLDEPESNVDFHQRRRQALGSRSPSRGTAASSVAGTSWSETGREPAETRIADPSVMPAGHRWDGSAEAAVLTWASAVERLNQLEIRSFRLEPALEPGMFIFICSYTPERKPWLSQRFEAQADEPLKAVEKVLAQLDDWVAEQ